MRIHLISYATGIFLHRQWFLAKSALANKVVDTVTNWTPSKLNAAGFAERAPEISLHSRGSGYWAWKPFIIEYHLAKVDEGDIILYCDVGRRNGFKLLDRQIGPYIEWMEANQQDVMPGVLIPWYGDMSMWTKRDAFVFTNMDTPETHMATPIQASFSLWRAGDASRSLAAQWMDWCAQPRLVNDQRGASGLPELPDFIEHRHDQSLLTLCCLELGVKALDLGRTIPPVDTQHPSEVGAWHWNLGSSSPSPLGRQIMTAARPLEAMERTFLKLVPIGKQGPQMPS